MNDLWKDKGQSGSKDSIISVDARTSLGFPGVDNGALFEERAFARYPVRPFSLFLLFFFSYAPILARLHTLFASFSFRADFPFVLENENSKLLVNEER